MFRSIFSKLIAIFITILIIGFSITGVILYFFLSDFAIKDKVDVLSRSAEKINNYLSVYLENRDNPFVSQWFEYIIESYSTNTNSFIWVVNSDGYIADFKPDNPQTRRFLETLRDESGHLRLNDKSQYSKVLLSDNIVVEKGSFYGLFKGTGVDWLTVGKRFKHKDEVLGAVFLHTQIPEVNRLRTSVFRLFLASVGFSVFISVLLAYLFSIKITRPLQEINNVARIIAAGEFQKRLNISSKDEIGELAESFNHMIAALQNIEEMRRSFIANVSHELRTPMTSIRGFVEGILDGTVPDEKQKYYLGIVRDEINRLNRLVNDLLDLAKMEAGEMEYRLKNFNINELVRRSIIKLENQIVEKDIQVRADFEEEDICVNADSDAIERVLINLLHNAIKFTPEKGKIDIGTSLHKDRVFVSIEDSGIGIEKDEIELIWDRFHKSDKSRSRDKSGTGLGLAIVKSIISEHKQNIWVESQVGKGTRFTFTLSSGQ